jgi:membrane protease YdiL (CAAX protease family)
MTHIGNPPIAADEIVPTRMSTVQTVELCVFVFLVLPSLLFSFFAAGVGGVGFTLGAVATIARDLALVSLVLFFLWRNSEPVRLIGWRWGHGWREVMWGVVLFVPMFYAAGYLERFLHTIGVPPGPKSMPAELSPHGTAELVLGGVLVVVVALAEETIFRGYLIRRLRTATGSTVAAVILASVIFAVGHGYEGTIGVLTVGFMGLVFALVYLWRGSLVAPIVMHFLQDFLGIVVAPLIGAR